MEVTNCEQHVLAELDCERRKNERLVAENSELAKQLAAMTKRANGYRRIINRPKTPILTKGERPLATEINPLIIPFDNLLVTRSKREYRETVRGWGEEPCELECLDGATTAVRGKGLVIWVSKKIKGCDLYGLAAHEATHAACDMLDMIGEDEPAAEELAYMVQSITTGIIIACEGA